MHIRNAGEIVPRLLPRLWTSRHLGRRRVDSTALDGDRRGLFLPTIWFSSRPESFLAATIPSDASATWGAASSANGIGHGRRNASHATPISTSVATPAADAPSPTFLWDRTVHRYGYISARVWPRTQPEAQPCQPRGASPRRPRPLWAARHHRHLCYRRSHRTYSSWSSRAATDSTLPDDCPTADSGRSTAAPPPSPTSKPTAAFEDAPYGTVRRTNISSSSAWPSQRRWSRGYAAACSASAWTEAQVHARGRPAAGRPEGEEEPYLEANRRLLPWTQLWYAPSEILHETES